VYLLMKDWDGLDFRESKYAGSCNYVVESAIQMVETKIVTTNNAKISPFSNSKNMA
jgi:hypothetical protein